VMVRAYEKIYENLVSHSHRAAADGALGCQGTSLRFVWTESWL